MKIILKNTITICTEFYQILYNSLTITSLLNEKKISSTLYQPISNGRIIPLNSLLTNYINSIIEFRTIIKGGKGGFGTLLKTQPARKKLTNNFDACRDLSGRRVGHVNQEKLNKEWKQKKKKRI